MLNILVLHGPNLNLLGVREPEKYGTTTLAQINHRLQAQAEPHQLAFVQSNAEHQLVDAVHQAMSNGVDGMVINPAGLTHSSVVLRDAILAVNIPFVEVHLSNIYARESFRQHSYFSDIAIGVISGFGAAGYEAGLNLLIQKLASD